MSVSNCLLITSSKNLFIKKSRPLYDSLQNDEIINLESAMMKARLNAKMNSSPGAGLETSEEQMEAAYADLINTTVDQRRINELSSEEMKVLSRGSTMWEDNVKTKRNKFGILGDLFNVFKALNGGAHIEKDKFGRT